MFFWKKDKTKEILNNIKNIDKELKRLESYLDKKNKAVKIINGIIANVEGAKKEVKERAVEETKKPSIDSNYDSQIIVLGEQEIKALEDFEKDLQDNCLPFLEQDNEKEYLVAQQAVIERLKNIEKSIREREDKYEKDVGKFVKDSLKARIERSFKRSSDEPPIGQTDGVSWSSIVNAVRELEGWIELTHGGTHRFKIWFPNSTQPVPISEDMPITRLASQIKAQLNHLPEHKRETLKADKIRNALRAGTITAAA